MMAFPEGRLVDQIVDTLRQRGGLATLDELEGQMARRGTVRLPPDTLDLIVRATIRANRDGRGLGCFTQPDTSSVRLIRSRLWSPTRPTPR
jgi:hypothetical protein